MIWATKDIWAKNNESNKYAYGKCAETHSHKPRHNTHIRDLLVGGGRVKTPTHIAHILQQMNVRVFDWQTNIERYYLQTCEHRKTPHKQRTEPQHHRSWAMCVCYVYYFQTIDIMPCLKRCTYIVVGYWLVKSRAVCSAVFNNM